MHEFSIAQSIVAIAEEEVQKAAAKQVSEIELDIGKLSGVEIDSLEFVWDVAVKSSVLKHARHIIHHIPGKAKCLDCDIDFEMEQLFDTCPSCHQYFNDIVQGKELKIRSLTLI